MRTLLLLSFVLLYSTCLFAQADTVYFTDEGVRPMEVPKNEAKFFRLPIIKDGGKYKIEEYYISGKMKMSSYVNSPDSMLLDGYAIEYYENGNKKEYGNYLHGGRIGQWKMKYEDTDRVWVARTYYNSESDTTEVLRSFYRSGKLKRVQYIIQGKRKHKSKDGYVYNYNDTGICYSELGEEIHYTPFELMPESLIDVNEFIAQTMHYPLDAAERNIQGRINVQFCVLEDGSVSNIKIISKWDVSLAKEAVRVVKAMPKWKPGEQDDKRVKVFYTLPITFRLE